ncbi:hypothetical protein LJR231_003951 [Phyllobacterium sp. LjRoot231]|uniref:hypothetical protein n=1 Tax=Phyllobacterium sp. LjRoot231 TaxID=3342289 RepID=UPI003ECEE69B
MLALKLTLVPAFLLAISLSGKWWGPAIAGWLAGLPVVAGPILYLLILEYGNEFGVKAATLSLFAILASESFNFGYAWACRRTSWEASTAVGLVLWLTAAYVLSFMPVSVVWAVGAAIVAVVSNQALLPRGTKIAIGSPLTKIDLTLRMIAGAALTVLATSASSIVGPQWSGLLAVFPLLAVVMAVASHRAHGPDFVIALFRGMIVGRFSFAVFCLWLVFALPYQSLNTVFLEASIAAVIVQWIARWTVKYHQLRIDANGSILQAD